MLHKKVNAMLPGTSVRIEDTSNSSPPAIRSPSLSASSVLSGQGSMVSAGRSLTWCHSTQLGHHGATGPAALVLWGDSPFLTPKQLLHSPCSGTSHLPADLALFRGESLGAVISAWNHLRNLWNHRFLEPGPGLLSGLCWEPSARI